MKIRQHLILGSLFIASGVLFAYVPVTQYYASHNVAANVDASNLPQPVKIEGAVQGRPIRIKIPSVNINVPIVDGYYDAKKQDWTLTNTSAQYATITPQANNVGGNTFIYGHNQGPVFERLPQIKPGDQAIIYTDSGYTFTYTFKSARETNPRDDSLFYYQGAPILTLQTCSGFLSQNRELFTFELTKVV
jgi:LPXTG-site transpeptidase (sortase) family protein